MGVASLRSGGNAGPRTGHQITTGSRLRGLRPLGPWGHRILSAAMRRLRFGVVNPGTLAEILRVELAWDINGAATGNQRAVRGIA